MSKFDEWFEYENRQIDDGYYSPIIAGGKQALGAAYKEGMLESARIAEMSKDYLLPADDLADVIATQIRKYAEDG